MTGDKPWQTSTMECAKCAYSWVAVHPTVAEYLECPTCHHMTPAPYINQSTGEVTWFEPVE